MKTISMFLLATCLMLTGCTLRANAPLPQGALNAADASVYRTLADAHGFTAKVRSEIVAGKAKLTPAQTTVFNKLVDDLNAADILYQAYHAAGFIGQPGTTANLTTTANKVSADLAAATSSIQTTQ